MEISHRNILRNKRMVLCQAINSQLFIDHLSSSKVLTKLDTENLNAISSDLKKNEKLLDILPKRGPRAFGVFLEVLQSSKLLHLLGDDYKDGKIRSIKMDEERPAKNAKDHVSSKVNDVNISYDVTDVPGVTDIPDVTDVLDVTDVPGGDVPLDVVGPPMEDEPFDVTGPPVGTDIDTDPGGKQAKLEEFDIVDTPFVANSSNGFVHSTLTDDKDLINVGMFVNTDTTDLPDHDATDSAPPSAASNEFEDGPFSRPKPGSQKGGDMPPPQHDIVQTPVEFGNCYPMTTTPRGHFLIINNKDFLPESTMEPYPRNGTDIDAAAMIHLFEELGYIVHSHRNLTCYEMRSAVKKIVALDYTKVSAVACCFLSHGKEGILYGTDGEIEIRNLTSYFRETRGLVGKPKMFFFQACQGSDYMDGIEPTMEVDGPGESYGNDISLPTEADFIYAYSTVPGFYSWRNSARGSWFIQGIVEIFRRYAHKMDVIRMLTRVNEMVSTKKSATGQRVSHHKRQISSIITQLRYELYLFPQHGPLSAYQPR